MYICCKPSVLDFFFGKDVARPVRRQSQRARDDFFFSREADEPQKMVFDFLRGGVQYLFQGSFAENWCTVWHHSLLNCPRTTEKRRFRGRPFSVVVGGQLCREWCTETQRIIFFDTSFSTKSLSRKHSLSTRRSMDPSCGENKSTTNACSTQNVIRRKKIEIQ